MDQAKEAVVLELADLTRRIASLEFLLSEGNSPGSVIQMNVVHADDVREVLTKARERRLVLESELRVDNRAERMSETSPVEPTEIPAKGHGSHPA
jgi:hypothetical protein